MSQQDAAAASKSTSRIRVCVRLRPFLDSEIQNGESPAAFFSVGEDMQTVTSAHQPPKGFQFDLAMGPETTQSEVFEFCSVDSLLKSALKGFSATVLTYGTTGSGKTYTLTGPPAVPERRGSGSWPSDSDPASLDGIIPRATKSLFRLIRRTMQERNADGSMNWTYSIRCSYAEVYNEKVNCLLNPEAQNLPVRWGAKEGFFVENLTVVEVLSEDDLLAVVVEGLRNRKVAANEVNKDSSRSHALFTVWIESRSVDDKADGTQLARLGKIHFVDLAGSERIGEMHFDENGARTPLMRETLHINKSLLTLGKVITILSDRETAASDSVYVPYRESQLTKLLMDSFGGNSRTLMIACISPLSSGADETVKTLTYAGRALKIQNRPTVNMDPRDQLIEMLKLQIDALKTELRNGQLSGPLPSASAPVASSMGPQFPPRSISPPPFQPPNLSPSSRMSTASSSSSSSLILTTTTGEAAAAPTPTSVSPPHFQHPQQKPTSRTLLRPNNPLYGRKAPIQLPPVSPPPASSSSFMSTQQQQQQQQQQMGAYAGRSRSPVAVPHAPMQDPFSAAGPQGFVPLESANDLMEVLQQQMESLRAENARLRAIANPIYVPEPSSADLVQELSNQIDVLRKLLDTQSKMMDLPNMWLKLLSALPVDVSEGSVHTALVTKLDDVQSKYNAAWATMETARKKMDAIQARENARLREVEDELRTLRQAVAVFKGAAVRQPASFPYDDVAGDAGSGGTTEAAPDGGTGKTAPDRR